MSRPVTRGRWPKAVIIPVERLCDERLSVDEAVLLGIVAASDRRGGGCTLTNAELAPLVRWSERHVSRVIGGLIRRGYLESAITEDRAVIGGVVRTLRVCEAEGAAA